MATARDELKEQLCKLFNNPLQRRLEDELALILDDYRIQSKGGSHTKAGTAREILMASLMRIGKERVAKDLDIMLAKVIGGFRMQLKQGGIQKRTSKSKANVVSRSGASKAGSKATPVAGGPQRRQHVRGECPKCHSMGVVLARSYSGDEYLSCIYCGYQSHRSSMEFEFDLPLAAELLNRRFDEKGPSKKT
ncbi:MAG: hypothetical protein JKY15_08955 [Deltaproteobacteria bacterium]|nr:hypothetical protein [Deltaproteobacteria bacterium]